jgi:hypothetical protein
VPLGRRSSITTSPVAPSISAPVGLLSNPLGDAEAFGTMDSSLTPHNRASSTWRNTKPPWGVNSAGRLSVWGRTRHPASHAFEVCEPPTDDDRHTRIRWSPGCEGRRRTLTNATTIATAVHR